MKVVRSPWIWSAIDVLCYVAVVLTIASFLVVDLEKALGLLVAVTLVVGIALVAKSRLHGSRKGGKAAESIGASTNAPPNYFV